MGYITTVSLRNDSYHDFKQNADRLTQIILDAMDGVQQRRGNDEDHIGSSANAVIIQKPRHADDTTLYLHAGNTVIDVSKYNEYEGNEWAVDALISEMEYRLENLKKVRGNG